MKGVQITPFPDQLFSPEPNTTAANLTTKTSAKVQSTTPPALRPAPQTVYEQIDNILRTNNVPSSAADGVCKAINDLVAKAVSATGADAH